MEKIPKPTLILDRSDSTTNCDLVDDRGFFLNNKGEGNQPTIVRSPFNQGQREEDTAAPPQLPGPPPPQTITTEHEILLPKNLKLLGLGGSGYVYKCPTGFAYKEHASQREVEFMKVAGDCSITPLARVLREINGVLVPEGLVMELATPSDFKLVPPEQRVADKNEMVNLVERLHGPEIGIVHGDIKPANFLRCRDGKLRLCDFDSARLISDENVEGWEGFVSERYVAPSRGYPDYGPPTVINDEYALAISVWELFTGKDALSEEDMEEVLKDGRTVDIDELEDDDIRAFVRKRLRDGGAKV
jgi:serine/threonine protein kinase